MTSPAEYPKIVYQVPRAGIPTLPAAGIEGVDFFLSLEPVAADGVERIRQIKLVRPAPAVIIHIGPVIGHQPIDRVPQREIISVQHWRCDPPRLSRLPVDSRGGERDCLSRLGTLQGRRSHDSAAAASRWLASRPGRRLGSVRPQPHSLAMPKSAMTRRAAAMRLASPSRSSKWMRPR